MTAKSDYVAVPSEARVHWRSAVDRAELRDAVIAMMERDDSACVALAAHLSVREASVRNLSEGTLKLRDSDTPTSRFGKRQGFQLSLAARRAIELRAVALATELLASEGWQVEDVSAIQSYDILIRRGPEIGYVEVKGTTGSGREIQITAAEVEFARSNHASMRLIVVSEIDVALDESGAATASGGTVRSFERWAPQASDLKPVSFFCAVPEVSAG